MSLHKPLDPVPPLSLPLEGRLSAHRRLLVELLQHLPEPSRKAMQDWIDDRALYRIRDERAGDLPGEGIEFELARADEFQVLKRLLRASAD